MESAVPRRGSVTGILLFRFISVVLALGFPIPVSMFVSATNSDDLLLHFITVSPWTV
jgi:hypothetical protein